MAIADIDLPQLLIGVGTLGTAALAWRNAAKGRREAAEQQRAANEIAQQKQDFDYYVALAADQRAEIIRLYAALDDDRVEHIKDLDRVKGHHQSDREDCRAVTSQLRDIISTLRSVVLDEATREAAKDGLDIATEHLEDLADG